MEGGALSRRFFKFKDGIIKRKKRQSGCFQQIGYAIIGFFLLIFLMVNPNDFFKFILGVFLFFLALYAVIYLFNYMVYCIKRPSTSSSITQKFQDIDYMSGFEFEQFICHVFNKKGYETEITSSSGDFGVDIIAQKSSEKIAIQVKRHNSKVSRHAVSDAVAGKSYYGCNCAMVVTNSTFTEGAKDMAAKTQCILIDREILSNWINEPSILFPSRQIRPILGEDIETFRKRYGGFITSAKESFNIKEASIEIQVFRYLAGETTITSVFSQVDLTLDIIDRKEYIDTVQISVETTSSNKCVLFTLLNNDKKYSLRDIHQLLAENNAGKTRLWLENSFHNNGLASLVAGKSTDGWCTDDGELGAILCNFKKDDLLFIGYYPWLYLVLLYDNLREKVEYR